MDVGPIHPARRLRYALTCALLDAGRPLAVEELVRAVGRMGLPVPGRAGKTVSDALRWERRRGRVVRLRRGVYVVGHVPRSTQWWIRRHLQL